MYDIKNLKDKYCRVNCKVTALLKVWDKEMGDNF